MQIELIRIKGFRNFKSAYINFREKTLIIGSNDVGKTNLLHAIRILMDRTLSDLDIEPVETDFHVAVDGTQGSEIEITIKLYNIQEDAVLSRLKGAVSDKGETYLKYVASKEDLSSSFFIGHSPDALEEIEARTYLKYIHLRFIQSSRDLSQFIRSEKRHLLRLSKEVRVEKSQQADQLQEERIQKALTKVNRDIGKLSYVTDATKTLNEELHKLSHHHNDYSVNLEASAVNFSTFIDQLGLGAKSGEKSVGLGGDGRNNQILMALWKAKSEREHDLGNEAIIYCIEEPEAHLHPHQQRKLAQYLIDELPGQVFVTTHSPQITSEFSPDCIIRIYEKAGRSRAASKGCSECIEDSWRKMGYRMSILPAEAFFSDAVLLVEGPSEILFYHELAKQLGIDLDFYNISILSVQGIDFNVYVRILSAMGIPWALRTDNDITKIPRSNPPRWRLSGLNRALKIAGETEYKDVHEKLAASDLNKEWKEHSLILNPKGIFISKVDLENDLGQVCKRSLRKYAGTDNLQDAVKYMQGRKAIRMGEFLMHYAGQLRLLKHDDLAKPLFYVVDEASDRRSAKPRRRVR